MTPADLAGWLRPWGLRVRSAHPVGQGWNSRSWYVDAVGGGRYVAKLADPAGAVGFATGMRVARYAAARGLACGPPVPTAGGALVVRRPEGLLALLERAEGVPPDLTDPADARRVGATLARAHRVLRGCPHGAGPDYAWPWRWVAEGLARPVPGGVPPDALALARHAWAGVVEAVAGAGLTTSLLHADPGPEGFLLAREPARDALLDWTTALRGPLLYDLAVLRVTAAAAGPAAMHRLVEGYLAEDPALAAELPCLDAVLPARWVANLLYFADRIGRGVTRGEPYPGANRAEFERAHRALARPAALSRSGPDPGS